MPAPVSPRWTGVFPIAPTPFSPSGDLDLDGSFELRHIITKVLEPEVNVIIDLRRVNSIEAEGLSALVGSARRVRAISP